MSYKDLKSYQQSTIIYDFTVEFCERYIDKTHGSNKANKTYKSRMTDQMVQAARSGKQNIVEGSAQRASKKTEIKLIGVARASLQELLEDYEDFLRQNGLKQWAKDDVEAKAVRGLSYESKRTNMTYRSYLESPETAANAAICLINQANFLLDRQIEALEKEFLNKGGYSENLLQKRKKEKWKNYWAGRF